MLKKAQSEKEIESEILYWLNFQPGIYAIKMDIKGTWDQRGFHRKTGRFVPVGGADILGVYKGRAFAFECKTPAVYKRLLKKKNEHELRQASFLQRFNECGGFAHFVCSLGQVQDLVRAMSLELATLPEPVQLQLS